MQTLTAKPTAFLFGAGASARLHFPMVTEFFSQFKGGDGSMETCKDLARYIRVRRRPDTREMFPDVDAEEVFGLAEQMREVEEALAVDHPALQIGRQRISASELYKRLCKEIIDIYSRVPDQGLVDSGPLRGMLKLADARTPRDERLWFFTTNYDTVIEDSLKKWNDEPEGTPKHVRLEDGFETASPRRFKAERFDSPPRSSERLVNLVKLHGSVTWKRETTDPASDVIETGMRAHTDYDCVLYFGYKRFPEHEPFVTLHRLFKRALSKPLTLVTVGFQFGDPYLCELVDFALEANSELRVICCLRTEPKGGTAVHKLIKGHGNRFELLRDAQGNLVPFGETFTEILQAQI